jgi:hypothetical protein
MASIVYNSFKRDLADGTIDLPNDTIKVMLVDDSYTPDADHDFADDVSADELSGTGYAAGFGGAGRKTLASKSFSTDTANDRAEFTADALVWSAIDAGTAKYAIFIKEITNDAASRLLFALDLDSGGSGIVTNGGDLTVTPNADGFLQLG